MEVNKIISDENTVVTKLRSSHFKLVVLTQIPPGVDEYYVTGIGSVTEFHLDRERYAQESG